MVSCYTKLLVLETVTGRYIRISVDELKKSMRILNNLKKHRENKTVTLSDYCEIMGMFPVVPGDMVGWDKSVKRIDWNLTLSIHNDWLIFNLNVTDPEFFI